MHDGGVSRASARPILRTLLARRPLGAGRPGGAAPRWRWRWLASVSPSWAGRPLAPESIAPAPVPGPRPAIFASATSRSSATRSATSRSGVATASPTPTRPGSTTCAATSSRRSTRSPIRRRSDLYGKILLITIPLLTFGGLDPRLPHHDQPDDGRVGVHGARGDAPLRRRGDPLDPRHLPRLGDRPVRDRHRPRDGRGLDAGQRGRRPRRLAGRRAACSRSSRRAASIRRSPRARTTGTTAPGSRPGLLAAILMTFLQMVNVVLSALERLLVLIGPICLAAYALPATERITNGWLKVLVAILLVRFAWTIVFILFSLEAVGPSSARRHPADGRRHERAARPRHRSRGADARAALRPHPARALGTRAAAAVDDERARPRRGPRERGPRRADRVRADRQSSSGSAAPASGSRRSSTSCRSGCRSRSS